MAFSLFGHQDRLRPVWSFTPGGLLWRILPTAADGFIGEVRTPETLLVSFFHVDAGTGRVIWKDRSWGEPWWTGLEAVHGSVAIFHEFVKPDLPDHGRIHVVDLPSGELLWSAPDLAFAAVVEDRMLATRLDTAERTQMILDLRTGEPLGQRTDPSEADEWSVLSGPGHATAASFRFPEPVASPSGDPNGESTEEAIRGEGWTVRSSYETMKTPGPRLMRQRLRVVDDRDRVLMDQIIHSEARAIVPDTFFVWNGLLYYLKEQRTLVAIHLPGPTA